MSPEPSIVTPLVLHVVYRFDVGGLENGVVNLINGLPRSAWRHGIVSLTEASREFCRRIERDDVEVIALHKREGHGFALYPKLYSLLRKLRPAIVHTRNLAALEATVPAAAALVPVRIHGEHGRDVHDLDGSNRTHQLIRRAFKPFVHRWVALSRDLEDYLRRRIGVSARRILQIHNGVDTTRFAAAASARPPVRPPIAGSPFSSPDLWLVGTVGRMQAVKDQVNLARAFVRAVRLAPESNKRLRLVLVGDGPLRAECEAILRDAGVAHLAWLAGERADVPDIMRGLDCFVLPSLAEGISNTILEAMASGLPVIATRVGGNAELVEDGMTGRLVPAADSEALAREIIGYYGDPPLARRHGWAGRQLVERSFSIDRMVARYHRLYESELARRGAGLPGGGEQRTRAAIAAED